MNLQEEIEHAFRNREDPDLTWFKETMNIKSYNPIEEWVQAKLRERSFAQRILPCLKVN